MKEDDDGWQKIPDPEDVEEMEDTEDVPDGIKYVAKNEVDFLTRTDLRILRVLCYDLILTPSIIAENIDRSRETVSRRLNVLQAGNLVKKVERGKYEITEEGELALEGKSHSTEKLPELDDI